MTDADVLEARRLLNMPTDRLAALAGVPPHVITRYEQTGKITQARMTTVEDRLGRIRNALERAGVIFGEEPGVKLRKAAL